ncbi:hypothetical protein GO755_22690 [Spirosoma sp. HMF4905]|uniref:Uncharacterized protein n=1 Tax=Spirosoma arboris TaxID=2682092 RepID=A0A7K1SGB8_9BACT|nr:hypothetical protein [Spirosoma arboris]MVM32865.1 hypothetical protein [Spirosoma arboris]
MKIYPPVYTDKTKESVLLLFSQDVSSAHIAQVLHISQDTVFAILDGHAKQEVPEKLPSVGSLITAYKPESGTLEVNLLLTGVSPSAVEWLTGALARLVNNPSAPII